MSPSSLSDPSQANLVAPWTLAHEACPTPPHGSTRCRLFHSPWTQRGSTKPPAWPNGITLPRQRNCGRSSATSDGQPLRWVLDQQRAMGWWETFIPTGRETWAGSTQRSSGQWHTSTLPAVYEPKARHAHRSRIPSDPGNHGAHSPPAASATRPHGIPVFAVGCGQRRIIDRCPGVSHAPRVGRWYRGPETSSMPTQMPATSRKTVAGGGIRATFPMAGRPPNSTCCCATSASSKPTKTPTPTSTWHPAFQPLAGRPNSADRLGARRPSSEPCLASFSTTMRSRGPSPSISRCR